MNEFRHKYRFWLEYPFRLQISLEIRAEKTLQFQFDYSGLSKSASKLKGHLDVNPRTRQNLQRSPGEIYRRRARSLGVPCLRANAQCD